MEEYITRAQKIANILKEIRKKTGHTQQTLADELGLKQQTYAGYESGRHEPSIETLIQIANLFNVSMDYITGREEDELEEGAEEYFEKEERLKEAAIEIMLELMERKAEKRKWVIKKDEESKNNNAP